MFVGGGFGRLGVEKGVMRIVRSTWLRWGRIAQLSLIASFLIQLAVHVIYGNNASRRVGLLYFPPLIDFIIYINNLNLVGGIESCHVDDRFHFVDKASGTSKIMYMLIRCE